MHNPARQLGMPLAIDLPKSLPTSSLCYYDSSLHTTTTHHLPEPTHSHCMVEWRLHPIQACLQVTEKSTLKRAIIRDTHGTLKTLHTQSYHPFMPSFFLSFLRNQTYTSRLPSTTVVTNSSSAADSSVTKSAPGASNAIGAHVSRHKEATMAPSPSNEEHIVTGRECACQTLLICHTCCVCID